MHSAQDCLTEMMAILPEVVQNEDIHPANIPVIGEKLNPKSGQVDISCGALLA
jgi:hypothetical protein